MFHSRRKDEPMWGDIAMIVFSATLANHMGLVEAVEKVIKHKIPVVNCSRCLSFWLVIVYSLLCGTDVIHSVAVSFLSAYAALWFELSLGLIDNIYKDVYKSSFTPETDTETDKDSETEVS